MHQHEPVKKKVSLVLNLVLNLAVFLFCSIAVPLPGENGYPLDEGGANSRVSMWIGFVSGWWGWSRGDSGATGANGTTNVNDPAFRYTCADNPLITILAVGHLLSSVMRTLAYYVVELPLIQRQAEDRVEKLRQDAKKESLLAEMKPIERLLLRFSDKTMRAMILAKSFLLSSGSFANYIYLLFAILGFVFPSERPFFYSLTLGIDLIYGNRLLKYVLLSVVVSKGSILQTGFLTFVVMYIFSSFSFLYMPNEYDAPGNEYDCSSLARCFSVHASFGLRTDISEVMADANSIFPRILYEDVYFVVVSLTIVAIFSGIIIDTFGELRENKRFIENDMASRCFICGHAASSFQKEPYGFRRHTKDDHCMWDYIQLAMYLEAKDETTYSYDEKYIHECLKIPTYDFLPVGRSLRLGEVDSA
mmetsp:Transcript_28076/g.71564  ORF Transcript_28076/g.71564 Transcript_28076/m.71564 type:complete len:418 (+) Transcript_28076:1161-2414(+)